MIHPRLGHSDKVTSITDVEFRVWMQYILSADDFGLMPCEAIRIQADNRALAGRPLRTIQRCLERLIVTGLLLEYRDGQDRRYVCDPVWQKWQHISYPKQSLHPPPPPDVLTKCDQLTQELFRQCFQEPSTKFSTKLCEERSVAEGKFQERSESVTGKFQERSENASRAREEANGKRLTANGTGQTATGKTDPATAARAGRLIERYAELYTQHRNGARLRLVGNSLEFEAACGLVALWPDDRLEKLAILVLTTDDPFITGTDRSFKIFGLKASWADDRLSEWEAKQKARA